MHELTIEIDNPSAVSTIFIGKELLKKLPDLFDTKNYSQIIILSDETVFKLYGTTIRTAYKTEKNIVINSGETHKQLETIKQIWQKLSSFGADRKTLLVNLGGGVIGDLGGFAASTYMRGIDFINIPTTLLAAADASIGGKTGFNFDGLKNQIGTFTQPKAVIIDIETFSTLEPRVLNEGYAEIIKHAAVFDADYFTQLESILPKPSEDQLIDILYKSCQLKADIVMSDEKESGTRKLLNFGHTIGHAIESLSYEHSEPLLHGEAVAIGMIAEAKLGEQNAITDQGTQMKLINILSKVSLPTNLPSWINKKELQAKIIKDKKNASQRILWVMLKQIGNAQSDFELKNLELSQLR